MSSFDISSVKGDLNRGQVSWEAPSNIALVKYWGKKGLQLPMNSSLSLSLSSSKTKTTLSWKKKPEGEGPSFDLLFEGKKKVQFQKKISTFLKRIEEKIPSLKDYHLQFDSENTFPHSVGIASSASSMASLALCLGSFAAYSGVEAFLGDAFYEQVSSMARLGSGSACRSIYGGWASWGPYELDEREKGSDFYATPFTKIDPLFEEMSDFILIVDSSPKKVSSTEGHALMEGHPFAEGRILQAENNMNKLVESILKGKWDIFQRVVENEALSLHSLMMSSNNPYILMHPRSLAVIEKIKEMRAKTGVKCCFTLDAGPNIHLLCPRSENAKVKRFIESDLRDLLENERWIEDSVGALGPKPLEC